MNNSIKTDGRKAVWGWAIYDWANSAFAMTVMAGLYPIFFKDYWSDGVAAPVSTSRLLTVKIIASVSLMILAPILGAIADKGSSKKKFLFFFAYMGAVMTAGLSLAGQGKWEWAAVLYVFGWLGFSGGNIFYDALLLGVAPEKKMDLVSALGYGMGYLGGSVLFVVNIWMIQKPGTFGLAGEAAAVKASFVSVGVWWAVFSIPIFCFVREPSRAEKQSSMKIIRAGFGQLRETFREIRHTKVIFLFLLAYWLYIDGVDTVIHMAVDYCKSLEFEDDVLIKALLILNFVGFPAAIGFGYLGQKIGAKRGIFIAIMVYLFITIWGAFLREERDIYMLAVIIGLVQGGVQSLSRSFYTRLIPADKSAEYFGFYNMMGKFAALFGFVLMWLTIWVVGALGYSEMAQTRMSITSLSLLFLAGGIILYFVNEEKGKEERTYLTDTRG